MNRLSMRLALGMAASLLVALSVEDVYAQSCKGKSAPAVPNYEIGYLMCRRSAVKETPVKVTVQSGSFRPLGDDCFAVYATPNDHPIEITCKATGHSPLRRPMNRPLALHTSDEPLDILLPVLPVHNYKYLVAKGKSPASIAKDFGHVPVALEVANPQLGQGELTPGTLLTIPDVPVYTVPADTSRAALARLLDTSEVKLVAINPSLRDTADVPKNAEVNVPLVQPPTGDNEKRANRVLRAAVEQGTARVSAFGQGEYSACVDAETCFIVDTAPDQDVVIREAVRTDTGFEKGRIVDKVSELKGVDLAAAAGAD